MAGDSTERSALVESKAAGTFQDNAYRNPTTEDTSSERTRTKYTESTERLDERSPLLSAQDLEDNVASLHGDLSSSHILELHDGETQKSKSTWYLFILTLSIGGLQMAWATELSNGSPFLLSLGMSKAFLAFVWIAGPLTGVLVQPYIGILSDDCRISWGKRKPFMLGGAVATILSLFALAWTREIVGGFLGIFGVDRNSSGVKSTSIAYATILVYVLDFSINAVQAAIRAFIVDNAPTHQQEDASAWAGRITGFGSILGYLSGYVDLPRIMPFFGNTQFKVLCVIAALSLWITVAISCSYIKEADPRLEGPAKNTKLGIVSFFRSVSSSLVRLPPQTRMVCEVQFFSWMGWFPFLFYVTTYIGQLYVNPIFEESPDLDPGEIDKAWEKATRVGSFALFVFAITSFAANLLLPFLIAPTYKPPKLRHSSTSQTNIRFSRLLRLFQIPWLTIRRAWLLAHLTYALCMALTFFISTPVTATLLTGLVGLPWALTLWAPFALISADISKRRDALERVRKASAIDTADNANDRNSSTDDAEDQAGVVLGLHNVAVSAPQIVSTLISSLIFKIAQRDRGAAGDESIAWVLRLGGVAALVAAYMTSRIKEEKDAVEEDYAAIST